MASIMTLADLLWFRWQRHWRSGSVRRLLSAVTLGLFGAYVGFLVGWIGLVLPETVAKGLPGRPPVRVLNEHLLTVFAGLIVVRFFLQRFDADGWRSFLSLPVPRPAVAQAIQVTSALSLLNLLPLVGVAALAKSTVAPAASPLGTAFWIAGTLLAVATTHYAHVGLRAAWARRDWGVVLGIGAAAVGLIGADVYGAAAVRTVSEWLFGGLQRGRVAPLLVLLVVIVGTAMISTAALRRYTYDWIDGRSQPGWSHRLFLNVRGWGPLSALVVLEGELMLRNRGPREQILAGLGVDVFFVWLIVNGALPVFALGMAPFMIGLLLSVTYGQFAFAWHGGHFDGLLARVSPGQFVRATLIVLGGLAVGPILLATPVVAWADPFFAVPMAAFALYHGGVSVPTLVWTGILWNRDCVNPEQSRFSFSGGSVRSVVLMGMLGVPPILFAALGDIPAMLTGVASLGALGLGTGSLWLPRLEAALRHRRHAMLEGFRGEWLSPYEWHW